MDDLISRAEAIDALKRKQDDGKGDLSRFYNTIIQHDIEAIMQLPPIQPEITHEQAVEYLQSTGWMQEHDRQMMLDGVHRLTAQPTIQPKRGKWIKTARWGRVYYCDQCRNYLDFDGVNAGRGSTNYCPNCGCRMDGGEQ